MKAKRQVLFCIGSQIRDALLRQRGRCSTREGSKRHFLHKPCIRSGGEIAKVIEALMGRGFRKDQVPEGVSGRNYRVYETIESMKDFLVELALNYSVI